MTFEELAATGAGAQAAREGQPISVCPWSPGDPAGRAWRMGWLRIHSMSAPLYARRERTVVTTGGLVLAWSDHHRYVGPEP